MAIEAAAAVDGGGVCVCTHTLLGPVSDFKGLGKVYLYSSFPYVPAPSCRGHHMCGSAALGIFPSTEPARFLSPPWVLHSRTHGCFSPIFFPFPPPCDPADIVGLQPLSCLPLLPTAVDGAELNPPAPQISSIPSLSKTNQSRLEILVEK